MSAVPASGGGPRPGDIEDQLKRDGGILHRAGIAMFPVGAGKKPTKPWKKGVRDYTVEHAQPDDLRDWLHDPRTLGWACIAGMLAKVFVFDAEAVGMAYPEILEVFENTPATAQRVSPSGGKHLYVRLTDAPEDYDWGGFALAKVPVKTAEGKADGHKLLAEVRGHGQYAVVTGPGRPTLSEDFMPVEMTVAEWEALIAPVKALHDPSVDVRTAMAYAKPSSRPLGGKEVIGSGDTADVLRKWVMADMNHWLQILDPGWSITSTDPRRNRMGLQRPSYGSPTEANESGNVQDGVLVVFSESVLWAEHGKGTSVGMAFAQAWFGGDFHRAMDAAEMAATLWVEDGLAPDPAGPFAAWPTSLLEDVHTAREALLGATEGLITPASEPTPVILDEEGVPIREDPFAGAEVTSLRVVAESTAADRAAQEATRVEREAEIRLHELKVAMRARELLEEFTATKVDSEVRAREAAGENPLGWLTFDADFWTMSPSWDFLLPDFWPVGASGTLYSGPGLGKSLLGLEWAACLATGKDVMGQSVPRRRVLYLDHENDPLLIRQRLEAMGFGPADDLSWLAYSMLGGWPTLDTKAGGERLLSEATRLGVDLVIIDTTARVIEGEENTADTFHALYRHSIAPLKAAGVAVMRFDHTGKDEEKGERGSSAKRGDVDLSYYLTLSEDERFVTLERHKNRPHLPGDSTLVLERVTVPVLRHLPVAAAVAASAAKALAGPDPLVERVLSYIAVNPGLSGKKITDGLLAAGVKVRRQAVTDALKQIQIESACKVTPGPHNSNLYTAWVDGEDLTEWTDELAGIDPVGIRLAIESRIVSEPEGGLE